MPGFFDEHGDGQQSYELDALPPKVLRQIVLDCIKAHVPDELHEERLAESEDRETMAATSEPIEYAWEP